MILILETYIAAYCAVLWGFDFFSTLILPSLNIILFEIMEKRSNTALKISWGFILFIHV